MNFIGISIGLVVGIISGIIVLAIMRTLNTASIRDAKSVKTLTIQLISVITLIAGASFLVQSKIFHEDAIKSIAEYYFYSLAVTFLLIMLYPLYRWIYKLGKELGEIQGQ